MRQRHAHAPLDETFWLTKQAQIRPRDGERLL
jgi:hypothetical protein